MNAWEDIHCADFHFHVFVVEKVFVKINELQFVLQQQAPLVQVIGYLPKNIHKVFSDFEGGMLL